VYCIFWQDVEHWLSRYQTGWSLLGLFSSLELAEKECLSNRKKYEGCSIVEWEINSPRQGEVIENFNRGKFKPQQ